VESLATTVEQATALGVVGRIGKPTSAPLAAPEGVIVTLGRKHGQFRVSAKSSIRGERFGAQVSIEPIGPATWQDVPGTGKARLITGHATGSLVWVRFRAVRGQEQSDWCTPVPVTVP
jgi:hypothetical protein